MQQLAPRLCILQLHGIGSSSGMPRALIYQYQFRRPLPGTPSSLLAKVADVGDPAHVQVIVLPARCFEEHTLRTQFRDDLPRNIQVRRHLSLGGHGVNPL